MSAGETTVAFTGALVDTDGKAASHISIETATSIAEKGGVLTSVPVRAKEGTTRLSIGGTSGDENTSGNLSASQLQFNNAPDGQASQIDIVSGKRLLLRGNGTNKLVTDFAGQSLKTLNVEVDNGTLALWNGILHVAELTANATGKYGRRQQQRGNAYRGKSTIGRWNIIP